MNSYFWKIRKDPLYLIVAIASQAKLHWIEQCDVSGARDHQIQGATFLLAIAYFAGQQRSSDLIPIDYKSTTEGVGPRHHRNPAVLLHKHLAAIGFVGNPSPIKIEGVRGKTEQKWQTDRAQERPYVDRGRERGPLRENVLHFEPFLPFSDQQRPIGNY
jgi:hypothetical protein